jgi:TRAP-type C4-dicarboxylate transport system permease small subunit
MAFNPLSDADTGKFKIPILFWVFFVLFLISFGVLVWMSSEFVNHDEKNKTETYKIGYWISLCITIVSLIGGFVVIIRAGYHATEKGQESLRKATMANIKLQQEAYAKKYGTNPFATQ